MVSSIANACNLCSVGMKFGDNCFSDKYVPTDRSLVSFDEKKDECRTICYRTNMQTIDTICFHHKAAYTSHFHQQFKSTKCSDPFNLHGMFKKRKRGKREGSKTANLEQADAISMNKLPYSIYPGQKLCVEC